MDETPLFLVRHTGDRPGSRSDGLAADLATAADGGRELPAALVESLRRLALELDSFTPVKPYDLVALATLQRQFDDTYGRAMGMGPSQRDPLADALTAFSQAAGGHPPGPLPD